ncbi:hypothetical protein B0H17DRAFT_1152103 [Mycena rosella]|uniref:Uncharacterized protein n=1 Tax=Mycena rosella TaxID=1033263 RepID=A0AAD7BG43_MYCRO|nr:hypothetical protein B0H17DRAFT_1152103 [Mycena rosella]
MSRTFFHDMRILCWMIVSQASALIHWIESRLTTRIPFVVCIIGRSKPICDARDGTHRLERHIQKAANVGYLSARGDGTEEVEWTACDCTPSDGSKPSTRGIRSGQWSLVQLACRLLISKRMTEEAIETVLVKWLKSRVDKAERAKVGEIQSTGTDRDIHSGDGEVSSPPEMILKCLVYVSTKFPSLGNPDVLEGYRASC